MELQFYGAAGRVTGSSHILRVNGKVVLLDCGLVRGKERSTDRDLLSRHRDLSIAPTSREQIEQTRQASRSQPIERASTAS